jgi:hypothetical protein
MDCRIKSGNDDAKNSSRDALRRPSYAHHHDATPKIDSLPAIKSRPRQTKGGEAPKGAIQPLAAQHQQALPPIDARARLRATFGARPPSGASPRLWPKRASALAQPRPRFTRTSGCGRYPHHQSRLSEAPRAPVVMPAGSMPGPPGSGSHSSARGDRTRSAWLACRPDKRP